MTSFPELPPCSIVIVTYNSGSVLSGLLDSLIEGMRGVNFDVIVADNGSKDDSVELASRHPLQPCVIQIGQNVGYAAAINRAVLRVPPQNNVLILNPDTRLLPRSGYLLTNGLHDRRAGIVVPALL